MIAFLALLFVLLVIYGLIQTKEGFNPMNTSPEHQINIPVNKIPSMLPSPPATNDGKTTVGNTVSEQASNGSIFPGCDVKPSAYPGMLPGPLPQAPYEQIAVASPLPYQDTALIKANRQQLINLLELIKGFLAFEAQEIAERSDPTIQLPLQTARTDFHTLQSEVEVLNRNPGIQPTITLSHLNEISSNLAFLQREVRLIGAAGPIQGPVYEFTKPVEGFVSKGQQRPGMPGNKRPGMPAAPRPSMPANQRPTMPATPAMSANQRPAMSANPRAPKMPEIVTEESEVVTIRQSNAAAAAAAAQKDVASSLLSSVVAANMPAGPSTAASKSVNSAPASFNRTSGDSKNASLKDLQDFIVRINCESVRLSASGTSDPITAARIVALADIKSSIDDIINQVKKDPSMEANIPVSKAELDKALPALGKPSDPLPQIIQSQKLPPGFANLLPSSMKNDPKATKEISNLMDKYANTLVNEISSSVKYNSTADAQARGTTEAFVNASREKKRQSTSSIDRTGFPSMSDLDNASNAQFTPMESGLYITDQFAPLPSDAGRGPSRFDWKERSKQIEQQVKKRGLKPSDFGIMDPKTKVSDQFSWKGYARMMCTRLQATMDPSLPETCGCPPLNWAGWRIAK
jgi:hypothetical protein